jgi:Sperm-tail PG-rich repeat
MGLVVLLLSATPNRQNKLTATITYLDQDSITNQPQYNHSQIIPKKISLKSKPTTSRQTIAPGPGNYDLIPIIGSSKSRFTIGSKPTSTLSTNPGPGEYQLNVSTMSKNFGAFSKDARENSFSTFTPGPGNYSINSNDRRRAPHTVYIVILALARKKELGPFPLIVLALVHIK